MPDSPCDAAVLISGGVDSAVLCIELAGRHRRVFPLYVRFGLRWEHAEESALRRFLAVAARPGIMPLQVLHEPASDVYGEHWSTGGGEVPDASSDDREVYLPGRNILLIGKAAVWCRLRGILTLALGSLRDNPFADSTPEFDRDFQSVLDRAMGGSPRIVRPYRGLCKDDVIRKGAHLPLRHTFSCLSPVGLLHCGSCNKCAERHRGFVEAGRADDTAYAAEVAAGR